MTLDHHPSHPTRKRRRWPVVVLALAASIWAVYELQAYYFEKRLETAIANYRVGSLQLEDYLAPPLPAGAPNAGWAVEAAIRELGLPSRVNSRQPDSELRPPPELKQVQKALNARELTGAALSQAELAVLRDALQRFAPAMAHLDGPLREAEEARFQLDYGRMPALDEDPNILGFFHLGRLLRARGELALEENRCADAARDAAGLYRLAYWTATAGLSFTGPVGGSRVAEDAGLLVQSLLDGCASDPLARETIRAEARRSDPSSLIARSIGAERADLLAFFVDPRSSFRRGIDPKNGRVMGMARIPGWDSWVLWNAELLIGKFQESDRIYSRPAYQRQEAKTRLDVLPLPRAAVLTKVMFYDYSGAFDARDRWLASLDLLEIALALEDCRDRQGHYPATLAQAGAGLETRIDPFSGEPYRYRREARGYRLYSVGPNFVDDGGIRVASEKGGVDRKLGDGLWRIEGR